MNSEKKIVKLSDNDFTTIGLVKYLNDNHEKANGEEFTTNDVQQYLRRRKLPQYIGGHPLKEKEYSRVGMKIITVDFSTRAQRRKNTQNEE